MKFVLKQYDTALRSFDLRSEGLNGFACTLLEKEKRHRQLFPLGLQLTDYQKRLKKQATFLLRRLRKQC